MADTAVSMMTRPRYLRFSNDQRVGGRGRGQVYVCVFNQPLPVPSCSEKTRTKLPDSYILLSISTSDYYRTHNTNMKAIAALSAFLLPTTVFAVVNGRCSGSWDDKWCICLDQNVCRSQGGVAHQGSPGNYPCPSDADNVWGCTFISNCPNRDSSTGCVWRNVGTGCTGTPLSDPVCPGGNDFICCDFV
ncbi:hypothetical protein QBC43DRAFT_297025 [Cladorrhinum sp. PSN259]|nr:hypothetical protein QBC43DRAFT_297025 [Cladorrhinum sp. PSN259]